MFDDLNDTASGVAKVWDDVFAMLKAPFVGELDLIHLFLLTGIVLVFLVAWGLILAHVKTIASEV